MNFSDDLSKQLDSLTVKQRRAVIDIIRAESEGRPVARLFKSSYSCPWCGLNCQSADDLAEHEQVCTRYGQEWTFTANQSTYYNQWLKNEEFRAALSQARREATEAVLSESLRALQFGTALAVREALRVIVEGERDQDRLRAAFGVLDRASKLTGLKIADESTKRQGEEVIELLEELRDLGD